MSVRLRITLLLALCAVTVLAPRSALAVATGSVEHQVLEHASLLLGHEPPARVIGWLHGQPSVRQVRLGPDGQTLHIFFRDGRDAYILPAHISGVRLPLDSSGGLPRPLARSRQQAGARAAVLEPFATELNMGAGAGDPEVKALQQAGFQVDQGYDQAVTVNTMASLSSYNVVYMHTHTGPTGNGDGVVATGQIAAGCPSIPSQLAAAGVVCTGVAGDTTHAYYGITSRFVSTSMGAFPRDAFLFLNGCELLGATTFWNALASRGVGVMVSWDNWSATYDDYLSGAALMNQMAQGASVAGALNTLRANGYGTSHTEKGASTLGYLGDGTVTLARAAGGRINAPTPTPLPTTPPTKVPAPTSQPTAAPSPTAPLPTVTSPSGIAPLHINGIRGTVAPGTQQEIQASTSSGTSLSFRVTFPNGDVMEAQRSADSTGVASFSFVQPASKITHLNRRAEVLVQTTASGTVESQTGAYTIGFGKIDVSAQPRRVSPGGRVSIWVHTRSRTTVEASVGLPGKKRLTLRGKTGGLAGRSFGTRCRPAQLPGRWRLSGRRSASTGGCTGPRQR